MARTRRAAAPQPALDPQPSEDPQAGLARLRAEAAAFQRREAELLSENARLFQELQESNRTLKEVLERQTATAEVLQAISRSPADLQVVLDRIAASAARLCAADDAQVFRLDSDTLSIVAHTGPLPIPPAGADRWSIREMGRGSANGRAVLDGQTVHVPDIEEVPEDELPFVWDMHRRVGARTVLCVPLLRQGQPLGSILLRRAIARSFDPAQIALLETFADQAVIAIENARLFQELQESNRTLKKALEQQTATAEILRVISRSPADLDPVLDAIVASAARLCGGANATIRLAEGDQFRDAAHFGDVPMRRGGTGPISPETLHGLAFLERRTIHVPDTWDIPDLPDRAAWYRRQGVRWATLLAPLLRDGAPIGVLLVRRATPEPFTTQQIGLLETFADQAVIAIENTRLFQELQDRQRELEERNTALGEALEQQSATSEVLRVIAASPTETQPVLEAIVERARRLCDGDASSVRLLEGDELIIRAVSTVEGTYAGQVGGGLRLGAVSPTGDLPAPTLSFMERRTVHIPDTFVHAPDRPPGRSGVRANLLTPLLRQGEPIGVLQVRRFRPGPYSDKQIALVETFAAQAVIAIENARLFGELQDTNRTLKEALAQQTATAEVLQIIAGSPSSVEPALLAILDSAIRLCDATSANIQQLEEGALVSKAIRFRVGTGDLQTMVPEVRLSPERSRGHGRALLDARIVHIPDIATLTAENDYEGFDPEWVAFSLGRGARTWLATPLLRGAQAIGTLAVSREVDEARPFTPTQIALLETFASQAVIALENTRLFTELQERLDHETATSEILRVIASSPTNLDGVLEAIAQGAVRVCGATDALIFRTIDGHMVPSAHHGPLPRPGPGRIGPSVTDPAIRDWVAGRAMVEGRPVHVPDLLATSPDDFPTAWRVQPASGQRTMLAVPLLRESEPVGAILIRRTEVVPFTDKQIALLQTFADQAVIAIENTRLFQELQDRQRELEEALEQQTATSDMLRVIAGRPADLRSVLDAICARAARLCAADLTAVFRYDGERITPIACTPGTPYTEVVAQSPRWEPRRTHVPGRAVTEAATVHVSDLRSDDARREFPDEQIMYERFGGYRSMIAVPLRQRGRVAGLLVVGRHEPGAFIEAQVRLLETFADQAVVAIESSRLFAELQDENARKQQELERARTIQQRLLPATVPVWPGKLELAYRFRAAVETSGDFYDVVETTATTPGAPPSLQIAVADTAGKGMGAALVMSLARAGLRYAATSPVSLSPAGTARMVSDRLNADVGASAFVACALATVEAASASRRFPRLRLVNAGQVPVLLCRGGETCELEPAGSRLPLGAMPDAAYQDLVEELRPNDVLIFCSDGLPEAPARDSGQGVASSEQWAGGSGQTPLAPPRRGGELFGFERLAQCATYWGTHATTAEAVAEGIWADVTAWCGEESHHDDMTLLVLRVAV